MISKIGSNTQSAVHNRSMRLRFRNWRVENKSYWRKYSKNKSNKNVFYKWLNYREYLKKYNHLHMHRSFIIFFLPVMKSCKYRRQPPYNQVWPLISYCPLIKPSTFTSWSIHGIQRDRNLWISSHMIYSKYRNMSITLYTYTRPVIHRYTWRWYTFTKKYGLSILNHWGTPKRTDLTATNGTSQANQSKD